MKFFKKISCLLVCSALIVSFFSCNLSGGGTKDPEPNSRIFFDFFDTVSTLSDYSGRSDAELGEILSFVESELRTYHELYDIYNEYDGVINIASINRLAGQGAVKVDRRIIDILSFAKEMHARTSGKINVAMGSVLKIWHDYRSEGVAVPAEEILIAAGEHTDIEKLIIDRENLTVELLDPDMSLDVGAVAKGYAVEMIAAELEEKGYSSIVLDVGGNLRTIGTKPSGAGWSTGVQNPNALSDSRYVYKTELSGGAMVTSGSYQRYYEVDGVRYHHIISGETLMPENYYLSVSVKADSSAVADALSTAIFNMKYEEAKEFVAGFKGITVVLVMPDGVVEVL